MTHAPALRSTRSRTRASPNVGTGAATHRWLIWTGVLVLLCATLIAYIPAMRAGYVWDDPDHVSHLAFAGTWSYLKWIWFRPGATPQYYPLTHTSFWIEYQLWGLRPAGYHAVNILLHIASSLLLWRLLDRLNVPGAWLAAVIFALHPVHVESVAWVTERKNTLSGFFYLLGANLALATWAISPPVKPECEEAGPMRWRPYLLCLACFIAAELSKTVTSSFPAALLLVLWWKRDRIRRRDLWMLVPFFVIAVGMAKLTSGMEKWNVGAEGPDFAFSFWQRLLIAGRAVWFYAGKLAWPVQLTFIYRRWHVDPRLLWQWVFPVAACLVVTLLWVLRRRIGKGPLVAVLFFVGTLFPALGFVNIYPMRFSFVADHFQYLASIGLIALFAALVWKLRPGWIKVAVVAFILLPLASLTFARGRAFRDEQTLWMDTLAKNPTCWIAMGNLGDMAAAQGRYNDAIKWSDRSLAAFPQQPEGHLARGGALAALGRYDEAMREYQAAIDVNPDSRGARFQAVASRAALMATRGDLEGAAREYEAALAISPRMETVRLMYCQVLERLNRPREAIDNYAKALELNPDSVAVRSALSALLARSGYLNEAMRYLAEAIELKPDARLENNYGVLLMQVGRPNDAAEQFSRAIQQDPTFPDPYDGLAFAREAQGRFVEAAELYRKALALNPSFETAREHLEHLRKQMQSH